MRLIDADALIRAHIVDNANDDAEVISRNDVNCAPTVDAVEVVHGHWNAQWFYDSPTEYHIGSYLCDKCGRFVKSRENYCPNCGAKMDEVSE